MDSQVLALLNESQGAVENNDALLMATAMSFRLLDFCPQLGVPAARLVFYEDPSLVPQGAPIYQLLTTPPADVPAGVEAYHTEDDTGRVVAPVFAQWVLEHGGSMYQTADSVLEALCHEVGEALYNPATNLYVAGPAIPQGMWYARECFDWVQGDAESMDIGGTNVMLPNYCLPAAFDRRQKGPFDRMGKLTESFTHTPQGYMIVQDSSGKTNYVFGAEVPDHKKEHVLKRGRFARSGS